MCVMVAGTLLAAFVEATSESAREEPQLVQHVERPWLTSEAQAQIIGDDGGLGPLFADVHLGGPSPSAEVKATIAAFARANRIAIDLDESAGTLSAIRFAVTFPGCCGYEGADTLALRLRRPQWSTCCGCTGMWINDWTISGRGLHTHARVQVNHVAVRWEPEIGLPELFARADAELNAIRELPGSVAEPYPFHGPDESRIEAAYQHDEGGLQVDVDGGRIVRVSFMLDDHDREKVAAALKARWGRPRIDREGHWAWTKRDRMITATPDEYTTLVEIRRR
jgi:hypothetical protein